MSPIGKEEALHKLDGYQFMPPRSRYFETMRVSLRTAFLLALPLSVFAQNENPAIGRQRTVSASGEATVKVKPDHAEIRIGVVSDAPTAQAAAQSNSRDTSQVITTLKAAMGQAGELKTSGYAISPQYQYGNNTPPKLTGYRATNTVMVEMDEIGKLGQVIDASVKAGANEMNGISFSLRDEQPVREQALREAAAKAKANAEAIAKALGVKVLAVLDAEATSSQPPPVRPMPMMARAMKAESTPVEAGTLEVSASVTVTLLIQ